MSLSYRSLFFLICLTLPQVSWAASQVSLSTFARYDQLNWSIDGGLLTQGGGSSHMAWDNLYSQGIKLGSYARSDSGIATRSYFAYADIYDAEDHSANFDYSKSAFSSTVATSSPPQGSLLDLSFAIGPNRNYWIGNKQLAINTHWLLGVDLHRQQLNMANGVLTIADASTQPNLNAYYTSQWLGVFVGFESRAQLYDSVVALSLALHKARYQAEGNWNFQGAGTQSMGFTQESDQAYGISLGVGLERVMSGDWLYELSFAYDYWQSGSGRYRLQPATGNAIEGRFQGVNWYSGQLGISLLRRF